MFFMVLETMQLNPSASCLPPFAVHSWTTLQRYEKSAKLPNFSATFFKEKATFALHHQHEKPYCSIRACYWAIRACYCAIRACYCRRGHTTMTNDRWQFQNKAHPQHLQESILLYISIIIFIIIYIYSIFIQLIIREIITHTPTIVHFQNCHLSFVIAMQNKLKNILRCLRIFVIL